jgi:hypothetical protein
LDPSTLVADGTAAFNAGKEGIKLINLLYERFSTSGIEFIHPEIRLNASQSRIEFTSGMNFKKRFLSTGKIKADLPAPKKFSLVSLFPYQPINDAITVINGKMIIDRDVLNKFQNGFQISLEYNLDWEDAIRNLVYTSIPRDSVRDGINNGESDYYWLHAELKTVESLKKIYSVVRIEDVELGVEVTVREHLRDLFDESIKMELLMNAKFSSKDRNERAKAIYYRQHHQPRLKGDINKIIYDINDLFQPSKFRSYVGLEGSNYRYKNCQKGITISDPIGPIVLPNYMSVITSTDLTLEEPAKEGKLIYKRTRFKDKIEKILNQQSETQIKYKKI